MAVIRQQNWLSQQRVDLPHLRAIESGIAADFDVLAGREIGGDRPLVIRGFVLTGIASLVPATSLQLAVADSILFNVEADESGTFLWLPSDAPVETLNPATNSKVVGSWTPGALNYVGIEFVREADDTTTDLVQFLDPNTLLETGRQVPLARTLGFRIVISTLPFSAQPNLVPVAKVTLNSSQVSAVEDARPMLFRLGSGGDTPSASYKYAWPDGRVETTTLGNSLFVGGDKAISSQKDWGDAIMTRLWEVGGGTYWYSATADRNVQMVTYGAPFSGLVAPVVGDGEYFSWDPSTSTVGWQNIRFLFDNTTGWFNDVAAGSLVVADGEAIYVDLQRGSNATGLVVQKAPLVSLGSGDPPGSRWVMAYRKGTEIFTRGWRYPVGTTFQPATTTSMGMVKLNQSPATPLAPVVVSIMANGRIEVTASGGNANAITGIGNGTGAGGSFTGGAGNAPGLVAFGSLLGSGAEGTAGGQPNSVGLKGIATGVTGGKGVYGLGGTGSDSAGVYGVSGGTYNSLTAGVFGLGSNVSTILGITGVYGQGGDTSNVGGLAGTGIGGRGGNGTAGAAVGGFGVVGTGGTGFAGVGGTGLYGTGGLTNGIGVQGNGTGTGTGVVGIGGSGNGIGVLGNGTGTGSAVKGVADAAANGIGVEGLGAGNLYGGSFTGGLTGIGVRGLGGATNGKGGHFTGRGGADGALSEGNGAGTGLVATGGASSGNGIDGTNGAGGSGFGIVARSNAAGGTPLYAVRNDAVTSAVAFRCDGSIDMDAATDVADTTAINNRLSPALIPKALGHFSTIVGGTAVTPNVRVNVSSITQNATYIEVTLAQPFAAQDYHVTANYLGSSDTIQRAAYVNITAANTFRIYPYQGNTGAALAFQDPTSAVRTFTFACFGKQA